MKSGLALVVCTKERPRSVKNLLQFINSQSLTPDLLVLVDSSAQRDTEHLFADFSAKSRIATAYIRSEPGLPRQRNAGVAHILKFDSSRKPDFVWFLDDDIEFDRHYLERGIALFSSSSGIVLLGSYDLGGTTLSARVATSIASLQIAKPGKLLRSGLVVPPKPKSKFEDSDFVPGFSMLLRSEVFEQIGFDEKIRMYGEDLEFQIRLSSLGRIGSSSELGIVHNSSPINRDSARDVSAFSDGFRWRLHKQFPDKVSGAMVMFSSAALLILGVITSIVRNNDLTLSSALGHWDFLNRMIRRAPVEQHA